MAICPWSESYCVGDPTIDSQHEYLFVLANDLVESVGKTDLTRNAMKLFRYVREHFNHEETVMRQIAYPAYRMHLALHEDLITRLSVIADSIHHDQWSEPELRQFMTQWLVVHIVDEDKKLAHFIQKHSPPAPGSRPLAATES